MKRFRFDTLNYATLFAVGALLSAVFSTDPAARPWLLGAALALVWPAWLWSGYILADESGIARVRLGFRRRLEWAAISSIRYGSFGRVTLRGPSGRISFGDQIRGYGTLIRTIWEQAPASAASARLQLPFTIRRSVRSSLPFIGVLCFVAALLGPGGWFETVLSMAIIMSVFGSTVVGIFSQGGEWFVTSVTFAEDAIQVRKLFGRGYTVPSSQLNSLALHSYEFKSIRHRRLQLGLGARRLRINGSQFATARMEIAEAVIRCYGRPSWAHLPQVHEDAGLLGPVPRAGSGDDEAEWVGPRPQNPRKRRR